MPLAPQIAAIVEFVNAMGGPAPNLETVDELREGYRALSLAVAGDGSGVERTDLTIGERTVAQYRVDSEHDGPRPTLVWVHGGGWVIGDLDTHDATCRSLARSSGVQVLSLDYRLAPEHRFPTAHDDVHELCASLVDPDGPAQVDPRRWALGGDSAGAHMATVVTRRRRDQELQVPALQVLVYPVADLADHARYPSYTDNAEGFILTAEAMRFFADAYVPDTDCRDHPEVSPVRADDLAGLPPALVLTAEYDPLRDEGEAYATRLAAAGVATRHVRYDGATHMFLQMCVTDLAQQAIDDIGAAVRAALSPNGPAPR